MQTACQSCHQQLRFDPRRQRAISGEGGGEMVAFARLNGIDLFTANSVALGLLTLEKALTIEQNGAAPSRPVDDHPQEPSEDDVIPLSPSVRLRPGRSAGSSPSRRPAFRAETVARAVAASIAAVALVVLASRLVSSGPPDATSPVAAIPAADQDPAAVEHATVPPFELERDQHGQILRVAAATPEGVLDAYCDAAGTSLQPQQVVRHLHIANHRTRYGIFTDSADGSRLAMEIHQHPRTRRWVAGDGRTPLVPQAADLLPLRR